MAFDFFGRIDFRFEIPKSFFLGMESFFQKRFKCIIGLILGVKVCFGGGFFGTMILRHYLCNGFSWNRYLHTPAVSTVLSGFIVSVDTPLKGRIIEFSGLRTAHTRSDNAPLTDGKMSLLPGFLLFSRFFYVSPRDRIMSSGRSMSCSTPAATLP